MPRVSPPTQSVCRAARAAACSTEAKNASASEMNDDAGHGSSKSSYAGESESERGRFTRFSIRIEWGFVSGSHFSAFCEGSA